MSVIVVALLTPKPGMAEQVIESWTTPADLDAHAAGARLVRLNELDAELLTKPYDVWFLNNVPLGDPLRGSISLSASTESA